jgi:hypothetical protein
LLDSPSGSPESPPGAGFEVLHPAVEQAEAQVQAQAYAYAAFNSPSASTLESESPPGAGSEVLHPLLQLKHFSSTVQVSISCFFPHALALLFVVVSRRICFVWIPR